MLVKDKSAMDLKCIQTSQVLCNGDFITGR